MDSCDKPIVAKLFDAMSTLTAETARKSVVQVAMLHGSGPEKQKKKEEEHILELRKLRAATRDRISRAELSKRLRSEMRIQRKKKLDNALDDRINKSKAGTNLKRLLKGGRRRRIAAAQDKFGCLQTSRPDIAEVFADFYEALYSANIDSMPQPDDTSFFAVNKQEVYDTLVEVVRNMKKNKACAEDRLVIEMLQTQCDDLLEAMALVFTDLLSGVAAPPAAWRTTKMVMLFKKGDSALPKNYRPIAVLLVLAKCYSGVLLRRVRQNLEEKRTPEEIGFRKGYSCSDLVHALRLTSVKAIEWGECVWMASLDIEKAFDRLVDEAMVEGLKEAGVDECSVQAIRRIYSEQFGFVQLDPELRSRFFSILRGVRQGDPLSPILFANTFRIGMAKLKEKWEAKNYGTIIGSNEGRDRLTYLLFADDTTLIATSR